MRKSPQDIFFIPYDRGHDRHTLVKDGFTIVELLIVIVVIAVLAAISVVAYTGVQQRARDTTRTNDSTTIRKALELYKADHGTYPTGGYYTSTGANWATLSNALRPYTGGADLPKDPINDATYYYRYLSGVGTSYDCSDGSRGNFYVIQFMMYENTSNIPASSKTFSCPSAIWQSSGGRAV